MTMKHVAVTAAGVVAGSFVVGPALGALGIERSDGFGTDDIVAALVIAATVILVGRMIH